MYRWYQQAEVCYAFLSDFIYTGGLDPDLRACRWFTRGWTLQELLAPQKIEFYDRYWRFFGNRSWLASSLARATRIHEHILRGDFSIDTVCAAQKMFWAAGRQTTRIEDQAYCLLGIFDVNMPLLYGEGEKAFTRLQQQIIAQSDDESIFAWTVNEVEEIDGADDLTATGMLAHSAAQFARSGDVRRIFTPPIRPPSASTHQGIEFAVTMYSSRTSADLLMPSPAVYMEVPLACEIAGKRIIVRLARTSGSTWCWHRFVTATHQTTSRSMLYHEIEAIVAGYNRINIVTQAFKLDWLALQPDFYRQDGMHPIPFNVVLTASSLVAISSAIAWTQFEFNGVTSSAQALSLWIILAWYWRLWNQTLWSIILLFPPLAYYAGLQQLGMLMLYLAAITGVHVVREYRRR